MSAVAEPKRPADAYFVMARLLGDDFLTHPCPEDSYMHVTAHGDDGVNVYWHVPKSVFIPLVAMLRRERVAVTQAIPS